MHANNEVGAVNDVGMVVGACRRRWYELAMQQRAALAVSSRGPISQLAIVS